MLEEGGRLARDEAFHRGFWSEPLLGIIPMPLIWNFLAVFLVALIFWWLVRGSHKGVETAENLLKKRYVSGEIDRKTYNQMKEDIKD